ncbi:hypothetical protein P170DRAFT_475176 [Aspergillus steynii IBT 23096]|uniref:Uncharacterized protein n=1 Tax=Aspergillus steynii IBT 23096 TaxID=1392250 RepID=A0A2I2G7I8_9EURO|nr:uncharacterized protein P170DRAFT_475176 [Aspergillus steynii IBT 23096]PLB48847.1 hypothetical protein P170DRAFT_475176 [Aspergillus steynii IBT 23096]
MVISVPVWNFGNLGRFNQSEIIHLKIQLILLQPCARTVKLFVACFIRLRWCHPAPAVGKNNKKNKAMWAKKSLLRKERAAEKKKQMSEKEREEEKKGEEKNAEMEKRRRWRSFTINVGTNMDGQWDVVPTLHLDAEASKKEADSLDGDFIINIDTEMTGQ